MREWACVRWPQICEEAPVQLESEVPVEPEGTSQRPSNVLVPKLLALFSSPYEDAKCLSVSIMNLLAGGAPSAVADHMDRYAPGQVPPSVARFFYAATC